MTSSPTRPTCDTRNVLLLDVVSTKRLNIIKKKEGCIKKICPAGGKKQSSNRTGEMFLSMPDSLSSCPLSIFCYLRGSCCLLLSLFAPQGSGRCTLCTRPLSKLGGGGDAEEIFRWMKTVRKSRKASVKLRREISLSTRSARDKI